MALTTTVTSTTVTGDKRVVTGTITWDSSYADNGESLTAANLGLSSIYFIQVSPSLKSDGSAVVIPVYDYTNRKLLAFWSAGSGAAPTEVSDTTNLSTYTSRFLAWGN